MNFVFDNKWVSTLWDAVKRLVSQKQDKITNQEMQQFLSDMWPDGPYQFEIDDNGCLIAHYTGIDSTDEESEVLPE